jgi:hypothetical protein
MNVGESRSMELNTVAIVNGQVSVLVKVKILSKQDPIPGVIVLENLD